MDTPLPSMMPKRAPLPTPPVAQPSEVETESSETTETVEVKQSKRPSLKPIPGHVVRFEEARPGWWVGTCSCKALVKAKYMDLVRHVKNVKAEMDEKPEPKPKTEPRKKPRRTGIPNRPLKGHEGLEKLYGTLNEGPKGRTSQKNQKRRGR